MYKAIEIEFIQISLTQLSLYMYIWDGKLLPNRSRATFLALSYAAKLVPLAYGIKKLQISCVVEDDKVRNVVGKVM